MPIYEYKCSRCAQIFEVMQSFSEAPLGTHPGCGGDVRKVLSAPGIIFKGSGFYSTDSRKDNKPSVEKSPGDMSKTEKKEEPKTDSPPPQPKNDSKSEPKK
jgi:putative FmdB family regulatory protein